VDRCGKSRTPPGFDPRTVQPVASRYSAHIAGSLDIIKLRLNEILEMILGNWNVINLSKLKFSRKLGVKNWKQRPQERKQWKEIIEQAKTHKEL
jgi:hypothetical protein